MVVRKGTAAKSAIVILCSAQLALLLPVASLSFWHDEVATMSWYVEPGPSAVFLADYDPNNHPLFSMLAVGINWWSGPREVAVKILSLIPAIIGGGLLMWWLYRVSGLTAMAVGGGAFLAWDQFAQLAPLARGYGLTLLATTTFTVVLMYVAGSPNTARPARLDLGAWGAGFGSIATMPHTAPFVAVGAGVLWLALGGDQRRRWAMGGTVVAVLSALWYAPIVPDLLEDVGQEYGRLLSPPDLVLLPVRLTRDEWMSPIFGSSTGMLLLVVALALLLLGVWEGRRLRGLLGLSVIAGPVVGAVGFFLVARMFVEDRFLFVFEPGLFLLFVLGVVTAGRGLGEGFSRASARLTGARGVRAIDAGRYLVGVVGIVAIIAAAPVVRDRARVLGGQPWEAFREVAGVVNARLEGGADGEFDVVTNSKRPIGLRYYLDRVEVRAYSQRRFRQLSCRGRKEHLIFIEHPVHRDEAFDASCLEEAGFAPVRMEQRGRGGYITVWLAPADGGQ